MTFYAALRARLIADGAVAALAGTRVTWGTRPQDSAVPAAVLTVISDPRPRLQNGMPNLRVTRVQVDCWADTSTAAHELAEAVIGAVNDRFTQSGVRFQPGEHEGPRDLGELVSGSVYLHRAVIDLILWHN